MDWRKRLVGIAVAGGSVAVTTVGCWGGGVGACNANPDPCCEVPDGSVCPQKQSCEQNGGTWQFGECIVDAGPDGNPFGDASKDAPDDSPSDASKDAANDGGDAADQ